MKGPDSGKKQYLGIREIAEIAGVSTATVSRVMNHPEKCAEKTREKVSKVIREQNYIPNDTIRTIFSNTSNIIAIFIYDINNPFFTKLLLELNNLCFQNHYMLMICDTENSEEKEKAYLEWCIAKRCMGIILTEGGSREIFRKVKIPVVCLDRGSGIGKKSVYVASDNYESARKVVNYFANLNHKRIAYIGSKGDFESVRNRYLGYKDELEEKGIPFHSQYVYCEDGYMNIEMGKNGLKYFLTLNDPPTAIFCACDMIALGVINVALQMKIPVPEKLSVCGFDHVLGDIFYMDLTTVEQDIPGIAMALFQAIINYQDSPDKIVINTKMIYGETCAGAADF